MIRPTSVVAALVLFGTAACSATLPPEELVNARSTYERVAAGPAAQVRPDDLLTAKQQLDRAEVIFRDDDDVPRTRDAAYIAIRKALFADATARTTLALRQKETAEKTTVAEQAAALQNTRAALGQERQAREDAERRAAEAMADLAKIAAVKKDDRGVVITLSGAVLFKTDKHALLPAAMVQLNKVAEALTRKNLVSPIVVEGHTDSQGNDAHNVELSQERAASVVNYLISRGVARDRITAKGMGSSRPIADNKTTEGRAQNRRVEIIVANGH